VEEGVERVVVLHGERIELVIVADGAPRGQPHPDLDRGRRAVDGIAVDPLFIDAATFAGGDIAAIESGGNQLVAGRIGQQVPGELPAREIVEGNILIEGNAIPAWSDAATSWFHQDQKMHRHAPSPLTSVVTHAIKLNISSNTVPPRIATLK